MYAFAVLRSDCILRRMLLSTENTKIPYFYILQDRRNGMYYAGSKCGKDANPELLMIEGGYTTSSNTINRIIEKHGINIFIIRKVKVFDDARHAYDYETRFLHKVNAKTNIKFYNGHNNDLLSFYSSEYKHVINKLYGVDNPFESPEVKERIRLTNINRYGVPYPMMSDQIKQKRVANYIEKRGVSNPMCDFEVLTSRAKNMRKIHGVSHPMQLDANIQTRNHTNQLKYGGSAPACSPIIVQAMKQTSMDRYGVDSYSKSEEFKIRNKAKKQEKAKRAIVSEIKTYVKKYRISIARGWYQKSDAELDKLLAEIKIEYGDIA